MIATEKEIKELFKLIRDEGVKAVVKDSHPKPKHVSIKQIRAIRRDSNG
jgi:hypothetical protein